MLLLSLKRKHWNRWQLAPSIFECCKSRTSVFFFYCSLIVACVAFLILPVRCKCLCFMFIWKDKDDWRSLQLCPVCGINRWVLRLLQLHNNVEAQKERKGFSALWSWKRYVRDRFRKKMKIKVILNALDTHELSFNCIIWLKWND